jgi:hypothetical protein
MHLADYFFLGFAGFFSVIGEYKLAFWISAFGILNHAGAAVRAVLNPEWYKRKRIEANLPTRNLSMSPSHQFQLVGWVRRSRNSPLPE